MNWSDIRKILKDAPNEVLLELIKGLYNLSAQNKAYIRTQIFPGRPDTQLLEKSRKQVIRAIYPDNVNFPGKPRFGESRKAIRAYQKATGDLFGTLDLMLLHMERGTEFTNDFGDIDEPFYIALETMLGNAIDLVFESPNPEALYEQYSRRFQMLERAASGIGWGYGDTVGEMVADLRSRMGDE